MLLRMILLSPEARQQMKPFNVKVSKLLQDWMGRFLPTLAPHLGPYLPGYGDYVLVELRT